jgi:hypothetical protein
MRSNLKLIAAAFIPLGFLGGLLEQSLGIAIGSAIFWSAVFLFLNSRKPNSEQTSDEFFPKVSRQSYIPHEQPQVPTSIKLDAGYLSQEAVSGRLEKLIDKAINFSKTLEWIDASYEPTQVINDAQLYDPTINEPGEDVSSQSAWLVNRAKLFIDNQLKTYKELLPFLMELESKLDGKLLIEQRRYLLFAMRIGMGLALIENQSKEGLKGFYHPLVASILTNPFVMKDEILRYAPTVWSAKQSSQINDLTQVAMSVGYFHSKYTTETPESVLSKVVFR